MWEEAYYKELDENYKVREEAFFLMLSNAKTNKNWTSLSSI